VTPRARDARTLLALLLTLGSVVSSVFGQGVASLSVSDPVAAEGTGGTVSLVFTVTRTGDLSSTITVGYTTANGTALSGSDYTAATGTVVIPSGSATATVTIDVTGDALDEADETLSLTLTGIVDVTGPPVAFASQQTFAAGNFPSSGTTADLNGDGRPDLVVTNALGRHCLGPAEHDGARGRQPQLQRPSDVRHRH
jgi:hypothetical protein